MSGLDLLAFGPHPDDLEIGLGGTLAKHAALGHTVGLCDLTRGEMSSNGTPDERVKEAETAGTILGAAWRENLATAGQGDRGCARSYTPGCGADPARASSCDCHSVLAGSPSRSSIVGSLAPRCGVQCQAQAIRGGGRIRGSPNGSAITSSTTRARRRSSSTCPSTTRPSVGRSRVTPASSLAQPNSADTRLNSANFSQLIESRDAQFGALAGVRFAEGIVVSEPVVRAHLLK